MLDDRRFHVHNGPSIFEYFNKKGERGEKRGERKEGREKRGEKTHNGFLNPLSISTGLRFDKIGQTMYSISLLIRGLYRMLFVH
jgi:hypothetical protein